MTHCWLCDNTTTSTPDGWPRAQKSGGNGKWAGPTFFIHQQQHLQSSFINHRHDDAVTFFSLFLHATLQSILLYTHHQHPSSSTTPELLLPDPWPYVCVLHKHNFVLHARNHHSTVLLLLLQWRENINIWTMHHHHVHKNYHYPIHSYRYILSLVLLLIFIISHLHVCVCVYICAWHPF